MAAVETETTRVKRALAEDSATEVLYKPQDYEYWVQTPFYGKGHIYIPPVWTVPPPITNAWDYQVFKFNRDLNPRVWSLYDWRMAEYALQYGVPSGWSIAGGFFASAAITILGSGPTPNYSFKPVTTRVNPFKGRSFSVASGGSRGSSVTLYSRSSCGSGTSWKGHRAAVPWYTRNGHIRLTAQRLLTRIGTNIQRVSSRLTSLFNRGNYGYERIAEDHSGIFQRDVFPGIRSWLQGVRPTAEEMIPLTESRQLGVREYGFDDDHETTITIFSVDQPSTSFSQDVGVRFRGRTNNGEVHDTIIDIDSSTDDSWLSHADTTSQRTTDSINTLSSVDIFTNADMDNVFSMYNFYHPTLFRKITPSSGDMKSILYAKPKFAGIKLDKSYSHYQVYREIVTQTDHTLDLVSIFPELQTLSKVELADLFMRAWHSGGIVRGPGDTTDAFHFPFHNYLGPGSDIHGNAPVVDKDDLVAFLHGIEYTFSISKEDIFEADERAIKRFYKYLKQNYGWHNAIGFLGLWIKHKFETAFGRLLYPTAKDLLDNNATGTYRGKSCLVINSPHYGRKTRGTLLTVDKNFILCVNITLVVDAVTYHHFFHQVLQQLIFERLP